MKADIINALGSPKRIIQFDVTNASKYIDAKDVNIDFVAQQELSSLKKTQEITDWNIHAFSWNPTMFGSTLAKNLIEVPIK